MIAIIDYGMGNLASVSKAFAFVGGRARVTSDPAVVAKAKAVVFPGVGAFGEAMAELRKRRLVDPIVGSIRDGTPFLGLCLGLQLLFSSSEESPGVKGLGVLPGRVRKFPARAGLKVPHMGWNQLNVIARSEATKQTRFKREIASLPLVARNDGILRGVPEGAFMYFVHSFFAAPESPSAVVATTEYGCRFPSVVSNGERLWATQFHPEKSQKWGLRILKNFLNEVEGSAC